MKSKIGRPKVRGGLHAVNVLLGKSQYSKIQALAIQSGFSVNHIIRQAVDAYLTKTDKSAILNNLVAHYVLIYPHPAITDENWISTRYYDKWFVENFDGSRGLTVRHAPTGYTCPITIDQIKNITPQQLELTCQILFHPREGVRYIPLSLIS